MSPENQTHRRELSRKEKLTKRLLPVALLAGGIAGGAIAENTSGEAKINNEASVEALASAAASATVEFGASDTDWGHGAAEKAIQTALAEGLSRVAVSVETTPESHEPRDIEEIVDSLPVYDQAETVLERAHYNEITPDPGDKLTVDLMVTLDSNDKVSYEITGAEIHDIANNQE